MFSNYSGAAKQNWQMIWRDKEFRYKLIIGLIIAALLLSFLPFFFQFIEKRKGILWNDFVLNAIAAKDVSIPIFTAIWSCTMLIIIAAIKHPGVFIKFLYAYIFLLLSRYITIFLFPLEAPAGLINLVDPLGNSFYGATFITKDLFFSGHVSSLFVMFLCQKNKIYKIYTLMASILVGVLVIVQHIHYTIDVAFAFPFAFLCYYLSQKIWQNK